MGVDPNVPRMARGYFREEIIGVADENRWPILWHLRVEENVRSLRHAGDCFHAEVSKCRNGPSIKVCTNEVSSVFGELEGVEHELGAIIESVKSQGKAGVHTQSSLRQLRKRTGSDRNRHKISGRHLLQLRPTCLQVADFSAWRLL